jgi:hypothetical protein
MVLGSIQPLREMSTRNLIWSKEWPARKADNFTAICKSIVKKMWGPRRLKTLRASTACYRDSVIFFWFSCVRFQIITAVTMKTNVLRDMTPYSPMEVANVSLECLFMQTSVTVYQATRCLISDIIVSNSVALVRERTIPTERPPLIGEIIAIFCG